MTTEGTTGARTMKRGTEKEIGERKTMRIGETGS